MRKLKMLGWYDAITWLIYTSVGFLIPVMGGAAILMARGENPGIEWFAGGGQFAVSSAGLLMTTTYFVARPRSIFRLPLTEGFVLAAIVGLLCGAFFFVLSTLAISGVNIDSNFYQWPSVILFGLALLIAFVAVGLDNQRDIDQPNAVQKSNAAQRSGLEEGFDATFQEAGQ